MLLMQDRVLTETMMHLVPSCSPPQPPTFDVSQLEFDLDLLPSLTDCVVPTSPVSPYSVDSHMNMFSPEPTSGDKSSGGKYPASPGSSFSPHSPYSPASRGERRISTQSTHSVSSSLQEMEVSPSINLQENLLEFTQLQDRIKQEQDLLLDSSSALSFDTDHLARPGPSSQLTHGHRYSVSSETSSVFPLSPDTTHQEPVKMEPMDFMETSKNPVTTSTNILLKQCLSDKSFQTKYNLKPFDFGVTTGFVSESSKIVKNSPVTTVTAGDNIKTETESGHKPLKLTLSDTVKIEPIVDLAADQLRKEIAETCKTLGISPNPRDWSTEAAKSWLLLTFQQFSIPMSLLDLDHWNMVDGAALMDMSEADFKNRLPCRNGDRYGENLFAQFDIWRTNYSSYTYPGDYNPPPPYQEYWPQPGDTAATSDNNYGDIAYMLQMLDSNTTQQQQQQQQQTSQFVTPKTEPNMSPPPYPHPTTPSTPSVAPASTSSSDFGVENMEEEDDDDEEESEPGHKSPASGSRPGTNIHLWQFVKELLLQPQSYGNYIHWIDRQKGIFKIVDSVKVATLWGKRKNRPAMNYDKLSRSLRQYYKKGIMKKTERSQRLVYQFCHPYHL